jgi:hypothetical protein
MTVVLTKPLADKLFGKESVVGKTIKIDNKNVLTVTAVVKVPQVKSALSFNAITSNASRKIISPTRANLKNGATGISSCLYF